jgi:hypothetical protein
MNGHVILRVGLEVLELSTTTMAHRGATACKDVIQPKSSQVMIPVEAVVS